MAICCREKVSHVEIERLIAPLPQRPHRPRCRGPDRAGQDPAAGTHQRMRLDLSRRPRHGHELQARLGPGRRDQSHLPAGGGGAADRRQERRWRGADPVRPLPGGALPQDRTRRGECRAQGARGAAQRHRQAEEGRRAVSAPAVNAGTRFRKYRKQPHAKEPVAAGARQRNLTRRATQGYISNIPKLCALAGCPHRRQGSSHFAAMPSRPSFGTPAFGRLPGMRGLLSVITRACACG